MTTMTLTLNGKHIKATQCLSRYEGIEASVRCTTERIRGHYGEVYLKPLPPNMEVFGPSSLGVPVANGQYQEMFENDWYLVYDGETHGSVLNNNAFCYLFADQLAK